MMSLQSSLLLSPTYSSSQGSDPIFRIQPPTPTVPVHPVPVRFNPTLAQTLEDDGYTSSGSRANTPSCTAEETPYQPSDYTFPSIDDSNIMSSPPDMNNTDGSPFGFESQTFSSDQSSPPHQSGGASSGDDQQHQHNYVGGKSRTSPTRGSTRHHPYGGSSHASGYATSSPESHPDLLPPPPPKRVTRSATRGQTLTRSDTNISDSSVFSVGSSVNVNFHGLGLEGGSGGSQDGATTELSPIQNQGEFDQLRRGSYPMVGVTMASSGMDSYNSLPYYPAGRSSQPQQQQQQYLAPGIGESDSSAGSRGDSPQSQSQSASLLEPILDDRRESSATVRPTKSGKKVSHARKPPPGHIKRPRNAFIIFRSHFCQDEKFEKHGIADHRHISRIAGQVWKDMDPIEKRKWELLADEEKKKHRQENPEYRYKPTYRKDNMVKRRRKDRNCGEEEEEERRCRIVAELWKEKENGVESAIDEKLRLEAQGLLAQGAGTHLVARNNNSSSNTNSNSSSNDNNTTTTEQPAAEGEPPNGRKPSVKIGELLSVHPGEPVPERPASSEGGTSRKRKGKRAARSTSKNSETQFASDPYAYQQYEAQMAAYGYQQLPNGEGWANIDTVSLQAIQGAAGYSQADYNYGASSSAMTIQAPPANYMFPAPEDALHLDDQPAFDQTQGLARHGNGKLCLLSKERKFSMGYWAGKSLGGSESFSFNPDMDITQLNPDMLGHVFASEPPHDPSIDAGLDQFLNYSAMAEGPASIDIIQADPSMPSQQQQTTALRFSTMEALRETDPSQRTQYIYLNKEQVNDPILVDQILSEGFGITFDAPDAPAPEETSSLSPVYQSSYQSQSQDFLNARL